MTYRVKNWNQYQAPAKKNRNHLPWFKIYRVFFTDYHVRLLTEKQRYQLLGILATCDPATGEIKKTREEVEFNIGSKSLNLEDFSDFLEVVDDQCPTSGRPVDDQCTAERREEESRVEKKVPRPNDEQTESKKTLEKTQKTQFNIDFDAFWDMYPIKRRRGKRKCYEKIAGYIGNGVLFSDILDGLERWTKSQEWLKEGGRFICAPEPWLNQDRWLEHPDGVSGQRSESNLEGLVL